MSTGERVRTALIAVLRRFGQTCPYKRGASTTSLIARVRVMQTGEKYNWFVSAESTAWVLPAYVLTVGGDFLPFGTNPVSGDIVTVNDTNYTVRKHEKRRLGAVIVSTTLYVSR